MLSIIGCSHAAKVAAAVEKPKYFKKSLLVVEEFDIKLSSPKNWSIGMSSENSFSDRRFETSVFARWSNPFQ